MLSSQHLPSVLIVDDEELPRNLLASLISSWGYATQVARDGQEALDALISAPPAVLVTDLMMPRMDGFELLKRMCAEALEIPSIVLTAFGNVETAVQTMADLGAFWFLEKPIQPALLRMVIDRAAKQWRLREDKALLQRELAYSGALGEMAGISASMQQVFASIQQIAGFTSPVLITGETGTGKELAARLIHRLSHRSDGPFVSVNCAAVPESLAESEIFGHEKGAFPGAIERRPGCLEMAQHGTLLLDGITDLTLGTQGKLLRVVEDKRVRRLGGRSEISLDVRILASSCQSPEEAMRTHTLREDLYYRLAVFHIQLPPLRERLDDLPILIDSILKQVHQNSGTRILGVDAAALQELASYTWPGNVRELRNVLQRAAVIRGEGWITRDDVRLTAASSGPPPWHSGAAAERVLMPIGSTVAEAERLLIETTLRHTRDNKTRAADILGISLKTLFNKLREYGSLRQDRESPEPSKSPPKIFVAMPFGPEFDPVFEDHISRVAANLQVHVERADSFRAPGAIIDDILAEIADANIVIGDCSGTNPNVFYEIGVAHTIGKPTVLITSDLASLPFDLKHLRVISYRFTPRGMKRFEEELEAALRGILAGRPALPEPPEYPPAAGG